MTKLSMWQWGKKSKSRFEKKTSRDVRGTWGRLGLLRMDTSLSGGSTRDFRTRGGKNGACYVSKREGGAVKTRLRQGAVWCSYLPDERGSLGGKKTSERENKGPE